MPKKKKDKPEVSWRRPTPSNNTAARLIRQESLNLKQSTEQSLSHSMASGASEDKMQEHFRVMKEDLKQNFKELFQAHQDAMDKRLDKMAIEIQQNNKQIKELKEEIEEMGDQVKQTAEDVTELEKKVIFLEDQSRRVNIRIRYLRETQAEDLRKMILQWLKELAPDLALADGDIERVHRVGVYRSGQPRDILVKFFNYYIKEQLMQKLRALSELKFQGSTVAIYNDLSYQTIKWRRTVKPITDQLKKKSIRYAWGYPIFLRFTYDGKQQKVTSLEQGMELLQSFGWDLSENLTSAGASAAVGK